ncbi:G patch domain-containing protein 4 [Misgurnus anguillicaudatus]|uniref:G patch domain-containing protein 4 n=1 Tax=Misgurnus anguillicaudatus TaxID=75329 RepID=UPI003CCF28E3
MAEATQDKPTGLKFAEQQLLRHGWEKGKGLGRRESGISEAIKVKIKCDKGGVGHKEGEQFTFHWWDHVFNKASSNLVVETGQDGVKVKADDTNNVLISNKKPTKAQQAKSMLYGSFVKSATLLSGEVQPEKPSESDDSSSSSEDEDHKLDLSSTTKLSDADLLKACGGRTAHKGARHGLTMNAKLARLEQQELEFMNKYGKNNKSAQTSTNPEDNPDATEKTKRKKSKRKEKPSEEDSNGSVFVNDDMITKTKKKKNRKAQTEESFNGDCGLAGNMESALTTEELHEELNEAASCLSVEKDNIPKKEKKKKKCMVASLDNTDVISEDFTDKQPHEDSKHQQTSDSVSKKKRKKKSSMDHHESSPSTDTRNSSAMMIIEDTNTQEDMEIEGQEKNRKKNKKTKKLRKMEEQDVDEQVTFDDSVPKKKKKKSKE